MIKHLTNEEIIEINKIALEISGELEEFQIKNIFDINLVIKLIENNLENDLYKIALGYCIILFIYHPFQEGNHRTSLTIAERFLTINGYHTNIKEQERMKLQKWRVGYEEKNDLERKFLNIACIENEEIKE